MQKTELKTLGIWMGFEHKLPIKREGIARFLFYLIKHLLKNYPLQCEIWCYHYNYAEISELFSELLEDSFYNQRLHIITNRDFEEQKVTRWKAFQSGITAVRNIARYGRGISWKQPYRQYKPSYPLNFKKRKESEGKLFNTKDYILYLPIDVSLSVLLIAGGIGARIWGKSILRMKPIIITRKYLEYKAGDLPSRTGTYDRMERIAAGERDKEEYIIYGPYAKLPEGYYEFELYYSVEGCERNSLPVWDIVFHAGGRVSTGATGRLVAGKDKILRESFYVSKEYADAPIEFRVWYKGKGNLRVRKVIINSEAKAEKTVEGDVLAHLANTYSHADCFLIPIVTLENGLDLDFLKLVILHDLVTLEFYEYFINENIKWKDWIQFGKKCAEEYGKQGAFFCGISRYVIKNQLLKFIKTVEEEKTDFAYHAPMIPADIEKCIIQKEIIFRKYGIKCPYIFYPTQIRPYKNLIVLLKALNLLKNRGVNIQLVLTGNFEHDKTSQRYLEDNYLSENIIFCGNLTEPELYGLYLYADVTVTTSLFEGGFPLQALESLLMDTPVILAKISVTVERLEYEGFNTDTCGLKLFNPEDANELANKIMEILQNRVRAVREQSAVKNKFAEYTWDNVSRKYYDLFTKILAKNNSSSAQYKNTKSIV
jgi:glycosyltransferase involved in cell wall biosynthesis